MPLMTQIKRDGQPLSIRWGWWHVECMTQAVREETGSEEPLLDLWSTNEGRHTVQQEHTFEDPIDGETLELHPEDVLAVWRE